MIANELIFHKSTASRLLKIGGIRLVSHVKILPPWSHRPKQGGRTYRPRVFQKPEVNAHFSRGLHPSQPARARDRRRPASKTASAQTDRLSHQPQRPSSARETARPRSAAPRRGGDMLIMNTVKGGALTPPPFGRRARRLVVLPRGQGRAGRLLPDLVADRLQRGSARRQEIAVILDYAVQLAEQGGRFFVT